MEAAEQRIDSGEVEAMQKEAFKALCESGSGSQKTGRGSSCGLRPFEIKCFRIWMWRGFGK